MNAKLCKRLRAKAREMAREQMVPRLIYNGKETKKPYQVISFDPLKGFVPRIVELVHLHLTVHPDCERGIYLKLKKEATV